MNWFRWPWVLMAMIALPYLGWRLRKFRHRTPAILFPGVLDEVPRSRRERWIQLPNILRLIALACLIAAGAGPAWDQRPSRQVAKSIGIQILVDRSSSMASDDMIYEGREQTRLDVVKRISHDFIFGAGRELRGRPSDMIGLIAFAADPVTLCPLTLSHELLQPALNSLRTVTGEQDGTDIGDAVALAAARFKLAEQERSGGLQSKVVILLTDGENNLGARSVVEAAELAHQWGVRIYTITIRPSAKDAPGDQAVGAMELLSLETNGASRVASDGEALRSIYSEINRLEKSDVDVVKFGGDSEVFTVLVMAALGLLMAEMVLGQTWLRRIP